MALRETSKTVWDNVEDDILDTFKGMSQADSYNFPWKAQAIIPWNGTGIFPFGNQTPCLGVAIGREECAEITGTTMRHCHRDIHVEAWANIERGRKGEPDASRTYQRLISDIEKALMTDHTRGGYASDTDILNREPIADPTGKGKEVGAYVQARVYYRHQVGDLYTQL